MRPCQYHKIFPLIPVLDIVCPRLMTQFNYFQQCNNSFYGYLPMVQEGPCEQVETRSQCLQALFPFVHERKPFPWVSASLEQLSLIFEG